MKKCLSQMHQFELADPVDHTTYYEINSYENLQKKIISNIGWKQTFEPYPSGFQPAQWEIYERYFWTSWCFPKLVGFFYELTNYSLFTFKSHKSKFKNFINEKFRKWFYFLTCILPDNVPHESSKDFFENIHF